MAGDEPYCTGWMGIVMSSDKAAYKLRMVICTYKLIYNDYELSMNGWTQLGAQDA
jgi:hypothetical protein